MTQEQRDQEQLGIWGRVERLEAQMGALQQAMAEATPEGAKLASIMLSLEAQLTVVERGARLDMVEATLVRMEEHCPWCKQLWVNRAQGESLGKPIVDGVSTRTAWRA